MASVESLLGLKNVAARMTVTRMLCTTPPPSFHNCKETPLGLDLLPHACVNVCMHVQLYDSGLPYA